ncbi:HEAT repeat domain-containing protein [Methanosarcina hadiensis]|uniref:HEAT repeat domain-containing protein n=1 Tax=Methanosarcina hadiensis TaxID=3078083 RepID=UPI003977855A
MDERSTDIVELLKEATKSEEYKLEKEKNKKISFFVFGLNKAIKKKNNEEKSKALFLLNVKREELLGIKHSIIIWVDIDSYSSIIQEAKDFFSWRTTVFEFGTRKENVIIPIFDLEDPDISLSNRKKLEERMEYYSKLTEIYMKDKPETSYNLAYCTYNLGKIQLLLGHANESIKYFDKLDSILKDINNKSLEESILIKLGDIYSNLGSINTSYIEKSIKYYARSLKISRELGDHIIERTSLDKLGSIYYQIGDIQTANEYYEQELKISGEFENHGEMGQKIHQNIIDGSEKHTNLLNNLRYSFLLPDKQKAWNDLHNLTSDENDFVRLKAVDVLVSSFSYVPDKQKVWNELIKLTSDEDSLVRSKAVDAIGSTFSQVPDKQQAWNDLHRLSNDEDSYVRYRAAYALGSAFSQVPDKQQAWNDLHRLTNDENYDVRSSAASALGSAFSQVPDKQQAWNDLHRLTNDQYSSVRSSAAKALGSPFSEVPDKQQAWDDLHRMSRDKDTLVRSSAASALGSAFSQVPDKQQAWNDLHRLTNDKDSFVRSSAAEAISSAFSHVPDKQQAWNDLHRLTNDKDSFVRSSAAEAISSAFSHVPDKQQAWNDLHRLTNDEYSLVRSSSNHSLGRLSIFMASQAEKDEDYKKELEKAIEFFEIAAKESPEGMLNPSEFCLPFYRSFHTIIFKKQEAKEEVDRYLAEAKAAVKGSASEELLLKAVENLAEALKEVQNFRKLDLKAKKDELNFYRKYADRAVQLMIDAEQSAPYATVTMRKGLPILDRNIRGILEEIQEKAKIACRESKGTDTEEIALSVSREVQNWELNNPEEMVRNIETLAYTLKNKVKNIPENENLLNKIGSMEKETDLSKKLQNLIYIVGYILAGSNLSSLKKDLIVLDRKLRKLLEEIQENAEIAYNESKGTAAEEVAGAVSREVQKWEIGDQEEMTQMIESLIETFRLKMPHQAGYEHIFKEIEGIRNVKDLASQYKIISRLIGLIPMFSSMPDYVLQDLKNIKQKTISLENEVTYLKVSSERLINSLDELQNPQEYLYTIQRNLEEIKNDTPEMKEKIEEVLYELYSPMSTTQKLKIAIPLIPLLAYNEMETDVSKTVVDKINELKNLISNFKK